MIFLAVKRFDAEAPADISLPEFITRENSDYINEISSKKSVKSRAQSLIGLSILSSLLGDVWEENEAPIIKRDKNSRPYIENCDRIDFNISHSDSLVVCAVATAENGAAKPRIGVDAEEMSQKDRIGLAERFFAEGEKEELRRSDNKPLLFAKLWTRKEAYIKWLGTGLATPLSSFDITKELPVRLETFNMDGNVITVCADSSLFPIRIIKK